ncbi:hypothetical protein SAMN05443144_114101 [Fodinibius roseus]|uniref:WD40-like Beta Propeller Repeat n=1 Tax=Fodinibius roseus TaxID=1194090 RepID=A0A1M5FAB4_9BACT|nr:hypothetical protein [Fodinibius roseus]SHF88011.1 hypothetical protein SAMN05443144_114101 [Fodinibius roseus]
MLFFFVLGCSPNGQKEGGDVRQVQVEADDSYGRAMALGRVDNGEIDEASGLAVNPDHSHLLWTHNDSGDEARIFLIQKDGRFRAEYHLEGATNRDWEDLAVGPGPDPDTHYLYIGDIGDNYTFYSSYVIYRLKQPDIRSGQGGGPEGEKLSGVDALRFVYPDGSHDAETLFIDPSTRDLYIVTRQERQDRVYRYPYPQSTEKTDTVEFVGKLPFSRFAGGDLSTDGQVLLLKTLPRIFIWHRKPNQSIPEMLAGTPRELSYGTGPQEEAIALVPGGNGYYTLSESKGKPVTLYFHPDRRE